MSEGYISFIGPMDEARSNALAKALDTFMARGLTTVHLAINSTGGQAVEGIGLLHILRGLPLRFITYNLGHVGSAAVLLHLAGDDRVTEVASQFLLHPPKFALNTPLTAQEIAQAAVNLGVLSDTFRAAVASRIALPAKLADYLREGEAVISADEGLSVGLATRTGTFTVPAGALFVAV